MVATRLNILNLLRFNGWIRNHRLPAQWAALISRLGEEGGGGFPGNDEFLLAHWDYVG